MTLDNLPTLNACLNGAAAVLLFAGWRSIRRKRVDRHRTIMIAAVCTSAAFLVSYILYHAHHGTTRFPRVGAVRTTYLTILATHTVLAAVQVPLIVTTFVLALRGSYARHRRWARVTLPIWMYVSVTGVIIYFMLYHLYPVSHAVGTTAS